jgi:multiple sugar transport system permease protein
MEGAIELRVFTRISLWSAQPLMHAVAMIAFFWSLIDYETPLVLMSNPDRYTQPLSLTNFVDEQGQIAPGLTMAASVISIVPVLIVFVVLQRRFIAAMTHTGIK